MESRAWESKRAVEMMGKLREMMEKAPPRPVPADISGHAASPIALFLGLLGVLMLLLCAALVIFMQEWTTSARISLSIVLVAGVGLIAWCLYVRKHLMAILVSGRLCRGRVVRVVPLPTRINGRWFFRVYVELSAPDGTEVTGKDTVDNWALEYFLWARECEQDIDVIYHPNAFGRVILPMKVALAHRLG